MTAKNRRFALDALVRLAPRLDLNVAGVVSAFPAFYRLLNPTVKLAAVVWIDGTQYTITRNGDTMPTIAVAATVDDNTITFKVNPTDDHEDPTGDQLTVATDDTASTIGTLVVDPDTHGGVVTLNHVEGTFNVTFSDPEAPGVEALVFAVNVGAGATSALSGTATVA